MRTRISLALMCLLPLSSCTTGLAMKAMNGIGMCPPGAISAAQQAAYVLDGVQVGSSVDALAGLEPERRINMSMAGASDVVALMFRTGHPRCRNMPTEEEFTPVLVQDGFVVGVGMEDFRSFQIRSSHVRDMTPEVPPGPLTFSQVYKSLPF